MKIIYSLLLIFLIVMLILVLRFFSNESLSTPQNTHISSHKNIVDTEEDGVNETTIDSSFSEIDQPLYTKDDLDNITLLLQHILLEAIDIDNLDFYSTVSSRIDFTYEAETYPFLIENQIYQGSLFRYPEHANYSITHSVTEYNVEGEILNDFQNKVDYSINNSAVYFSDEFGQLNYYTFSKEDAFLETVGQLERIAKFFQKYEQFVSIYHSEEKIYVSLIIPDETFLEYTSFFTETVFNGHFDTKTKEETERDLLDREQLDWPTKLYNHTITLVLTLDHKLESYYIDFESDAYGFDDSYRYYFKLMTSFFNTNQLTAQEEEQKMPSEQ